MGPASVAGSSETRIRIADEQPASVPGCEFFRDDRTALLAFLRAMRLLVSSPRVATSTGSRWATMAEFRAWIPISAFFRDSVISIQALAAAICISQARF
jgi:hypothetical protein